MSESKQVVEVLRVSTSQQDHARQVSDVERLVASHGLTTIRRVTLSVSGRFVRDNPEVQGVLAELKKPHCAGIAVSALDRLFRLNKFADFGILDHFAENKKVIYSSREGLLDPSTDAGMIISLMSGAQSGLEWKELRRRSLSGKELKRQAGRHVNGHKSLPRGLSFAGGQWAYTPDAELVRQAYGLLFAGETFSGISRAIGHGWSSKGIRESLMNPCWHGLRRYPAGERRSEPLEVRLPLEPLISFAQWQKAQAIIATRRSSWSKLVREPRFLALGALTCGCGRKFYSHNDRRPGQHDTYFCSSRFHGGTGCGEPSIWRETVDGVVEQLIVERFRDPAFLTALLARYQQPTPSTGSRVRRREDEIKALQAKQERFIDLYGDGGLTKEQYNRRMEAIADRLRELDGETAAPASPRLNVPQAITAWSRWSRRFPKLPFEEKRSELRRAFSQIRVVDAHIPELTVPGAFLGSLTHTNLLPRQRSWC